MKKLLLITGIALLSACQTQTEMQGSENPFYKEWDTPFGVPPFDQIKDDHYMPAFEKGMKENLAEIDAIVNNPEAPTFANTIEELERTGKLLTKVQSVFYNLTGSNTNPKLWVAARLS